VPDREFLFALEFSDETRFGAMLNEVAVAVLGYAGYDGDGLHAIAAALRRALCAAEAAGHRRCDVRFHAHAGELLIVVACAGRPEWRTTLALPQL
jgi:hypothetical protein